MDLEHGSNSCLKKQGETFNLYLRAWVCRNIDAPPKRVYLAPEKHVVSPPFVLFFRLQVFSLYTPKSLTVRPWKWAIPKGRDRIPTFHFQGRAVRFRECTPQKSNIDTKNCHFSRELPFPSHHFGYPMLVFNHGILGFLSDSRWHTFARVIIALRSWFSELPISTGNPSNLLGFFSMHHMERRQRKFRIASCYVFSDWLVFF